MFGGPLASKAALIESESVVQWLSIYNDVATQFDAIFERALQDAIPSFQVYFEHRLFSDRSMCIHGPGRVRIGVDKLPASYVK